MFKTNVGGIDRILRIVIGAVLIVGFFAMPGMKVTAHTPQAVLWMNLIQQNWIAAE